MLKFIWLVFSGDLSDISVYLQEDPVPCWQQYLHCWRFLQEGPGQESRAEEVHEANQEEAAAGQDVPALRQVDHGEGRVHVQRGDRDGGADWDRTGDRGGRESQSHQPAHNSSPRQGENKIKIVRQKEETREGFLYR